LKATWDREGEGLFDKMNGVGAHEVIVETPDHMATLASLAPRAVEDVLWAYRDRHAGFKKRQSGFATFSFSKIMAKLPALPSSILTRN